MRESNFSQPNQNRACVCISSALYDRRGKFKFLLIFISDSFSTVKFANLRVISLFSKLLGQTGKSLKRMYRSLDSKGIYLHCIELE